MPAQDCEQLTLYPEASHASPFPSPGSEEARKTTVTSGRKCLELSMNCGPLGLLEKMLRTQSEWSPEKSCTVWRKSVIAEKYTLYRLTAPVHGSAENECLSWPRPTTGAPLCGGTHNFNQMRKLSQAGIIAEEERRNLTCGSGGRSNPALLEWLMGFPIGWTG